MSGSRDFFKAHGAELKDFFYRAQMNSYGNPDIQIIDNGDGTFSTPPFVDGDWRYVDTWGGGEPFSGMSTIWYQDVVCWRMVYWGRVMPIPKLQYDYVLNFLSEALQHANPDHPWRGPTRYVSSDKKLLYRKSHNGGIRRFDCKETITNERRDSVLYEAFFRGGIVNKDLAVGGKKAETELPT